MENPSPEFGSHLELAMRRAIGLSRQGFPSPNPRVGCVILQGTEVVGEGFHAYAGGPHAEVEALRHAGELARGGTALVTLEPCNHHGRTPPCTEALIQAGIASVVYAVDDPNPRAAGGRSKLEAAGIQVTSGLLAGEAEAANTPWLTSVRRKRPFVALKVAMALDGRVALPSGESKWITGPKSRERGHQLRAEYGAVLVGAGTVLADNPALTVRGIEVGRQPTKVIWDTERQIEPSDAIFQSGDAHHLQEETPELVLDRVWSLGLTAILVEGGPRTWSAFLASGLVDVIHLFIAPKLLGSGRIWIEADLGSHLEALAEWDYGDVEMIGGDLCVSLKPRTA